MSVALLAIALCSAVYRVFIVQRRILRSPHVFAILCLINIGLQRGHIDIKSEKLYIVLLHVVITEQLKMQGVCQFDICKHILSLECHIGCLRKGDSFYIITSRNCLFHANENFL